MSDINKTRFLSSILAEMQEGYTMKKLLKHIEHFLIDHEISACEFGKRCKNDPNLVYEIRKGRQCRPKMVREITEYMEGMNENK